MGTTELRGQTHLTGTLGSCHTHKHVQSCLYLKLDLGDSGPIRSDSELRLLLWSQFIPRTRPTMTATTFQSTCPCAGTVVSAHMQYFIPFSQGLTERPMVTVLLEVRKLNMKEQSFRPKSTSWPMVPGHHHRVTPGQGLANLACKGPNRTSVRLLGHSRSLLP